MCSRVAGKNGHPSLDRLVQMRADRHGGSVSKDLLGREAMFRRPHSRLPPPLFRNLALGEHPNSVGLRYSADPFLKKRGDFSLLQHFSLYDEGKAGRLGN